MKITEWYARAVAAGIMPDWDNVYCMLKPSKGWVLFRNSVNDCSAIIIGYSCNIELMSDYYIIQLRKDGVDLVELWTKEDIPTEENIGEMCWFYRDETVILDELFEIIRESGLIIYDRLNEYAANHDYDYCLLATNGNIAPKPEDFKKVYGEV